MELIWVKMEEVIKRKILTKVTDKKAQHGKQKDPEDSSGKTEEEFFREFVCTWIVPEQDDKKLPKNDGHVTMPFFLDEPSKENPCWCPVLKSTEYCDEWA